MSGPDTGNWENSSLENSAWTELRRLAGAVIVENGWSADSPGPQPDVIYAGPAD